jgi:predicted MFS family arabinose efflux permease
MTKLERMDLKFPGQKDMRFFSCLFVQSPILAIVIGMFTVGCNSFMITGLLPQIGQTIGQPIAVTGQGITSFGLAYFLSAPLFIMIFSNKSVKRTIQSALLVFLLGNLITLTSKTIVLFLIGRFLAGIGTGIFTPLCVSIAINFGGLSTRGRVLSLIWGANSAGAVFGVPIGLYLSSFLNWQLSIAYIIILGLLTFIGFSLQNTDIQPPILPSLEDRFRLLADKKIMLIIGVTCFISMASLGLYSYVAPIHQSGAPHSLAIIVFIWGLGGFIGSSLVGFFIDLTKNPQAIVTSILIALILTFITIPLTRNLPYLGLIPFFMWGAFGWAIITPQQHILFELKEKQESILVALNASAIGLGSAFGTAIGGLIIAVGFKEINLPFFAATLLLVVFIGQSILIKNSNKEYST